MKQVYFVLTERCNLNCKHCIRGTKNTTEISFNDAKYIINQIFNFSNDVELILTGGEPTLHSQFRDILKYTTSTLNKNVTITSNGFTNYYEHPELTSYAKYQISLDGTREIHNSLRNTNCYDVILNNINRLKSLGLKCMVATMVNSYNYKCLKLLYNELCNNKIDLWYVNNMLPFGCANNATFEPLNTQLWNNLVCTMHKNCTNLDLRMKTQFDLRPTTITKLLQQEVKCLSCNPAVDKIYIYPDGTVYPCTCLKDFPLGNILTSSLESILNNEQTYQITTATIPKESLCTDCELKTLCNGGCKGLSYKVYKKFCMGDIRCPRIQ